MPMISYWRAEAGAGKARSHSKGQAPTARRLRGSSAPATKIVRTAPPNIVAWMNAPKPIQHNPGSTGQTAL